jgi:carotenoid cleavage dioxygenase-like enzyme
LATLDIITYALDQKGQKTEEFWLKSPRCAFIQDCAIIPDFIVLFLWPFEAHVARMKAGKQHWAWRHDLPATFLVIPRRKSSTLKHGWQEGEHRVYKWKNCKLINTAGAREDGSGIFVESSRVHDNAFPIFPTENGRMPSPETQADFVRWELDLTLPKWFNRC